MKREIAISDIHGCYLTFLKLLEAINYSNSSDKLYILGDCIDRGPSSKQVLDWIMENQNDGAEIMVLRGNHEQMMLRANETVKRYTKWMRNGGQQVVESFQVENFLDIEKKYWDFINELPYYIVSDKYVFVHAGLNFDLENPLEDLESIIWIRHWYDNLNKDWLGDKIILHGHTQVSVSEIEDQFDDLERDKVINIDAGCYAANYNMELGYLCAFDLTNRKLFFEKNIDSVTWFPPI